MVWDKQCLEDSEQKDDLMKAIRETVPSQTSDMGKKTVSVLTH